MVVAYNPLGATYVDGSLIGYHGEQDTSEKTFVYKPAQSEVDYCARHVFNEHLPKGRLWEAFGVAGTTDYALSQSVGDMIAIVFAYFEYVRKELNIDTTEDLIAEWEESVGLPDPCTMGIFTTLEQRRELVKLHLAKKTTVTSAEFEAMVKTLTGFDVIVLPRFSRENIYLGLLDTGEFDYPPLSSNKLDRFTFDVFVDYKGAQFLNEKMLDEGEPFDGQKVPRIIECLIERLKPSNSRAIYHYSTTQYNQVKVTS